MVFVIIFQSFTQICLQLWRFQTKKPACVILMDPEECQRKHQAVELDSLDILFLIFFIGTDKERHLSAAAYVTGQHEESSSRSTVAAKC